MVTLGKVIRGSAGVRRTVVPCGCNLIVPFASCILLSSKRIATCYEYRNLTPASHAISNSFYSYSVRVLEYKYHLKSSKTSSVVDLFLLPTTTKLVRWTSIQVQVVSKVSGVNCFNTTVVPGTGYCTYSTN
jgi:hypothetical protein